MPDRLSAEARSRIMRAIRDKNTKPEQLARKLLFAEGYRYRLHSRHLPGKPDLAFPGRKKIIFIHGCFWHQHNSSKCSIKVVPASNQAYWEPKLRRNSERDANNVSSLKKLGWKSLVVWECELRQNAEAMRKKMIKFLGPPRKQI